MSENNIKKEWYKVKKEFEINFLRQVSPIEDEITYPSLIVDKKV